MKHLIFSALLLPGLAGCGQADQSEPSASSPQSIEIARMEAPPSASEGPSVPVPPGTSRLLVYHAQMRLRVADLPAAKAKLEQQAQRGGGYLSAAKETRQDGEWQQTLTMRVRPQQFQGILRAISQLGTVELNELSTDDVTAEHADVAARLRTKRAVEQRYVALLSQAKKIADVLAIEEKIGEVREEIESTEARLKTLNDQVAYSTIEVTCYQPLPLTAPDAPVVSLGSRLLEALYDGWELLAALAVGAVTIWPLLLLGGAGWWVVRRWRRARAARLN